MGQILYLINNFVVLYDIHGPKYRMLTRSFKGRSIKEGNKKPPEGGFGISWWTRAEKIMAKIGRTFQLTEHPLRQRNG